MKLMTATAAALLAISAVPAVAGHHGKATIIETAIASPQHETLVAAVKAADLTGKIAIFLVNDPDFGLPDSDPLAGLFGGQAMTYYGR